jgi:hypothetical protein
MSAAQQSRCRLDMQPPGLNIYASQSRTANARTCRIPRVCLVSRAGGRSWRRADLPARGVGEAQCIGRPVPAGMCQTRSAAPAAASWRRCDESGQILRHIEVKSTSSARLGSASQINQYRAVRPDYVDSSTATPNGGSLRVRRGQALITQRDPS